MKEKKVCGIGICDRKGVTNLKSYIVWRSMLARCYSVNNKNHKNSYCDCCVCDEWLTFSNFENWYNENYIKGYSIDKDLLESGNRIYSPSTCCFLPIEINTLLIWHSIKQSGLPIGISYDKYGTFQVHIKMFGKQKRIGTRYFSLSSAVNAYRNAKKEYINEVAEKYYNNAKIGKNIYDALLSYELPQIEYDEIIIEKKEAAASKSVIQIKDGQVINTFNSINESAKYVGGCDSRKAISKCCHGLKKSYKGYEWRFKE